MRASPSCRCATCCLCVGNHARGSHGSPTLQGERDELLRRIQGLEAERAALQARLDPGALDQAVAAEAAAARAAAEAQARIEVEALQARIK